jgi:hypothetical protein
LSSQARKTFLSEHKFPADLEVDNLGDAGLIRRGLVQIMGGPKPDGGVRAA